jgi:hypothetical protein
LQLAAGQRAVTGADLLENLVAARFGERAGDPRKLPVGQATVLESSHRFRVNLIGSGCRALDSGSMAF